MKKLSDRYLDMYRSLLDVDLEVGFAQLQKKDWTAESFRFYTAVSVMSSSRIEGETLEIDSYLKHKLQNIEYLPNLTQKPNDLFEAYEFARDHPLSLPHLLEAHAIATRHLLPEGQRGRIRSGNMLILEQRTQQVTYEAASAARVAHEFEEFWEELAALLDQKLSTTAVFYFASLIHLVFVKIHPFNDGNGRTARLLEKWFISSHLGEKAWYLASEHYYYTHLSTYYHSLARVGLFYEELNYEKSLPFLTLLPNALKQES